MSTERANVFVIDDPTLAPCGKIMRDSFSQPPMLRFKRPRTAMAAILGARRTQDGSIPASMFSVMQTSASQPVCPHNFSNEAIGAPIRRHGVRALSREVRMRAALR